MKKQNTVSIIIPTYNYSSFLPMSIASILAQGWNNENLDILIIDDGSTDNTEEIVHSFRHPAVKYMRQNNAGLPEARNRGMRAAQGEYLVFLDADDLLAPGCLHSQTAYLEANPHVDIAVAASVNVISYLPDAFFKVVDQWPLCKDMHDIHMHYNNIAPVHAFTFRKKIVQRGHHFDTSLAACEDYDFWFKCRLDGLNFGSNEQALVLYRKHAASMSADASRQSRHDCLLLDRVFQALQQGNEDASTYGKLRACIYGCLETMRRIQPFDAGAAEDIAANKLTLLLKRICAYNNVTISNPSYAHIVHYYREAALKISRLPKLADILSSDITAMLIAGPTFEPGEVFIRQRSMSLLSLNRLLVAINKYNPLSLVFTENMRLLGEFIFQKIAGKRQGRSAA
jgi:glycosyltransferase involved in cell wall biosynthesis